MSNYDGKARWVETIIDVAKASTPNALEEWDDEALKHVLNKAVGWLPCDPSEGEMRLLVNCIERVTGEMVWRREEGVRKWVRYAAGAAIASAIFAGIAVIVAIISGSC